MEDYRSLVGFIPMPVKAVGSFAIPVYHNSIKPCYEYHILDKEAKTIADFEETAVEKPLSMVELPEYLEIGNVKVGDSAIFVIKTKNILFVGTAEEIVPHLDGIKKVSGDYFIRGLELAFKK